MAQPDLLFIGIRGAVLALDKQSGARVWETNLESSGFVTLLVEGNQVFAGTHGKVFCLNAATGELLWQDGLRGYGYGLLSLATQSQSVNPSTAAAEEDRRQKEASSATAASS